jgi:dienelactone hydrolase
MAQTIDYQRPDGGSVNGHSPLECIDASKVRSPVRVHCGEQDNPFPIDGVSKLEGKLRGAKVAYTGNRYVARQGFANQTSRGPG